MLKKSMSERSTLNDILNFKWILDNAEKSLIQCSAALNDWKELEV